MKLRVAVLSSHGGSNLQAILDGVGSGTIAGEVCVVVSNNRGSGAIQRAVEAGVPAVVHNGVTHPDADDLDLAITSTLEAADAQIVCLAGYMKLLGPRTVSTFRNRILNVHPSLLPRFGGAGMYGQHVHEAVIASGETRTGVTLHLVDGEYDHGQIVAQLDGVPVMRTDTPETLAARVLVAEHALYVATLARIATGEIDLDAVAVGTGS